ncbi:dihydrofolate reductase [Serinibacter salmoneus]|uniref:Dihydrofolate reductase n=1 Tax=Serinibacter salmoneus TaxID=556530 RepID=A0A2A9CXN5_9MICO|nr:dihydrofolate reductase [Serinibacter salmoneus]PFG19163.1 dihydrofolate reductase [Serinibacter salmoneus]
MLGMVWAQTPAGTIAADGDLPWDVPEDFAHFRETVAGHPVIMGRTTWESMPPSMRPMPNSRSVVVTRNAEFEATGGEVVTSLEAALELLAEPADLEEVWVMGGGQIYAAALAYADELLVSEIDVEEPEGDLTPAPSIEEGSWREDTPNDIAGWRTSENGTRWRVRRWVRAGRP